MTNTTAITLFALIGLLALTVWRIHAGLTTDKFKTAWSAGVLAVVIAAATDLNSDLGAAIAFAILVALLGRTLQAPKGQTQGPVSAAIGAPSRAGAQPAQPNPSLPNLPQYPNVPSLPSAPSRGGSGSVTAV